MKVRTRHLFSHSRSQAEKKWTVIKKIVKSLAFSSLILHFKRKFVKLMDKSNFWVDGKFENAPHWKYWIALIMQNFRQMNVHKKLISRIFSNMLVVIVVCVLVFESTKCNYAIFAPILTFLNIMTNFTKFFKSFIQVFLTQWWWISASASFVNHFLMERFFITFKMIS